MLTCWMIKAQVGYNRLSQDDWGVGKDKPELYLDKRMRRGISSFSALDSTEELEEGLLRLKSDIETKTSEGIRKQYQNELSSYILLLQEKRQLIIPFI